MALITVGVGGTQNITSSETDTVTFLGAGTLNITGTAAAPIAVTLSQLAGVGALDTINIQNATVTLGGVATLPALTALNIGTGGRLNLTGTASLAAGSTINFTGQNSVLGLAAALDLSVLSGIYGFAPGSAIDVPVAAASLSYADDASGTGTGGVLTLRNATGGTISTVRLSSGEYTTGSFQLSSDGSFGSLVSFPTTVTGVTASPATADLTVGGQAVITLATSVPVTVAGGTPTLTLNDGGTAIYDPTRSTASSLAFVHTVGAGQNTADLAVTGLNANGSAIKNGLGVAADVSGAVANPAGILQVDTLAPTIGGVSTNPGSGSLGAGQVVAITLTPSEAVTVAGGTPTLTLSDGGTATYNPGASTPTSLVFTTTVAAGQNTPDLAVTGIVTNGATIADAAGNAANLTGAVTNPAGVLAIDTVAPTVRGVSTSPGAGSLGAGQVVAITLTPSEAVTVAGGTPTLTLSDGGIATFSPGASTPTSLVFTTTAAAGQNTPDLVVTGVATNGATIADAAGNAADLSAAITNPAGVLAIDTVAPTVSGVSTTPGSGTVSLGGTVTLTVGTSEPVVVTGTPTLTLSDGGTATYSAAASTPTALVFTTTVTAGQNTPDLTVTAVNTNGGIIADPAGNAADLSGAVTNPAGTLVIDGTAPTATGVTTNPGSGTVGVGGTVTVTVGTSEPVVVTGTPTLSLSDGGAATYDPGASTPTSLVFTTTVGAGQGTADLSVTGVNTNGGGIADAAGNAANLSGAVTNPPGVLVVDGVAPLVTAVSATPATAVLGIGGTAVITVSTSKPVTVSGGTPTLALNDGGVATYLPGASTPTSLVFGTTVAAGQNAADLAVTAANLNGAGITDSAGNALGLAAAVANPPGTLQVDGTAPTITSVGTSPASGAVAAGQTVTVTLGVSEAVGVSGGVPTLSLNDGGTATFDPTASTPTSLVFTTTVAAGQNAGGLGVTAVNLNGATVADPAGNPANLSGAVGTLPGGLVVDTTPPAISGVTTSPGSGTVGTGTPVVITVATTEPVTVTGGPPTLSLNNGGTATYTPGSSTSTGLTFTYTPAAGEDVADLAVTGLNLNGGSITDAAGNAATLTGAAVNPAGTLTVSTASHPFALLTVNGTDTTGIVTVTAATRPFVAGTYGNLGTGTLSADGTTYTVSGTIAQVNAALAGVTLNPARGSAALSGYAASVSDANTGATTQLVNGSGLGSALFAVTAGDAVRAGSGADTLQGGSAAGTMLMGGAGTDVLVGSTAGGTLLGGTGSSTFFTTGGATLVVGGGARDVIAATGGTPVVFTAAAGQALVATGVDTAVVVAQGQDTVIGSSGALITSVVAGGIVFDGSGPTVVFAGGGSTVVGGAGASLIGVRGTGALVFGGSGPTTFIGGTGSSTVIGGSGGGSAVFAGAGGGLFGGGKGGNNVLVGGQGPTTLFGGGAGDVLFAGGNAGTVLVAGAGNETLQGAASSGNDLFYLGAGNTLVGLGAGRDVVYAGSGAATVVAGAGQDQFAVVNGQAGGSLSIIGFKAGTDKVVLGGYSATEAARATAGAVVSQGNASTAPSATITLSDNTRITFQGVTSLPANLFA